MAGRLVVNSREQSYLQSLADMVGLDGLPEDYGALISLLYDIPFRYTHPMDENRYMDVISQREEFGVVNDLTRDVTVLEVLISIASRFLDIVGYSYQEKRLGDIFWELLDNLDLLVYTDAEMLTTVSLDSARLTIESWLDRDIGFYGEGGIFPLDELPEIDQRGVDIWYQMNSYISEKYANCL